MRSILLSPVYFLIFPLRKFHFCFRLFDPPFDKNNKNFVFPPVFRPKPKNNISARRSLGLSRYPAPFEPRIDMSFEIARDRRCEVRAAGTASLLAEMEQTD